MIAGTSPGLKLRAAERIVDELLYRTMLKVVTPKHLVRLASRRPGEKPGRKVVRSSLAMRKSGCEHFSRVLEQENST